MTFERPVTIEGRSTTSLWVSSHENEKLQAGQDQLKRYEVGEGKGRRYVYVDPRLVEEFGNEAVKTVIQKKFSGYEGRELASLELKEFTKAFKDKFKEQYVQPERRLWDNNPDDVLDQARNQASLSPSGEIIGKTYLQAAKSLLPPDKQIT